MSAGAYLTDFGLARATATGSRYTRTGEAIGTPAYMSPEQARGETATLTPTSDVWALGCTLYELLAGRRAFDGDSSAAVIGRILTLDPPDLRTLRPDCPPGLARVVHACLAKSPRDRYTSAQALRADLDRLLEGIAPRPPRPGRHARVAVAAIALAAVAVMAWSTTRPAADAPAPAPATPPEAETLAAKARAMRAMDPRAAAASLATALSRAPDRHDWRLDLGVLAWAVGHGDEAQRLWRAIPRSAPEAATAGLYCALHGYSESLAAHRRVAAHDLVGLDVAILSGGRAAKLGTALADLLREDWRAARRGLAGESGWEAVLLRALVEGTDPAGNRAVAIQSYTEVLDAVPLGWAYVNRGVHRRTQGDDDGALADYERALALQPANATALANRGAIRRARGDRAGALADYDASLRARPDEPETLYNRGILRQLGGDRAGAVADYTAALALKADHAQALVNRATVREQLGDTAGALADASEALRCAPDLLEALCTRVTVRLSLGDLEGARADGDAAIAAHPDTAMAHIARARARAAAGDAAGAVTDFTEGLRRTPDDPLALAGRGRARERLGDAAGTLADLAAAAALRPADARLRAECGEARARTGDLDRAIADYTAALLLDPTLHAAFINRGATHHRRQELDLAIADYTAALGLRPDTLEAHANLGFALHAKRAWRAARDAYDEFLARAPAEDPRRARVSEARRDCDERAQIEPDAR